MTKAQSVKTLGAAALVAQIFIFQACGSNSPSNTNPGTGNTTGQGQAGSTGQGTAGTTGNGGMAGTSMGGSVGGTGMAGTTGAGGTVFGDPPCPSTVAKGNACAPTDIQFCYKTCGPEKSGVKGETCQTSGTYSEMSGCMFDPSKDYTCYKLPATADPMCTGITPKASDPCTIDMCHACNSLGGVAGGHYMDSGGADKTGFCVCQAANASGARVWSCGSDNGSWPCPGNTGC